METNLLIVIAVITAIAFIYLIRLEIRIWRYSTRENKLRLMWMTIKIATIVGACLLVGVSALTIQGHFPSESPGLLLLCLATATAAYYSEALMTRQLFFKRLEQKKGSKTSLAIWAVVQIAFAGLTIIAWHGIEITFPGEHGAREWSILEIWVCVLVINTLIRILGDIPYFNKDNYMLLTKSCD